MIYTVENTKHLKNVKVFLNGEIIEYVKTADDEKGIIEKYLIPHAIGDAGLVTETLTGKVEVAFDK